MRKFTPLILILTLLMACIDVTPPAASPAATEPPAAEPTTPAAGPTQTPGGEAPTAEPPPAATEPPAPTEAAPAGEPIYLAIIWHQHQPVYFKDEASNSYIRPWVRVHATKDYVDMAATVAEYPNVHVTFNLTPSLLRQIEDLSAGATDEYWRLALIPAENLTEEEKTFILERFFDTNRRVIDRFPRYRELLNKRDGGDPLTVDEFRDLQVLFNLAWVDPDWLAQEPLAGLVAKGSGFSEGDKAILMDEHKRLIDRVIPIHRELQAGGQIEVTMTPFAHPILPLLVDSNAAQIALPQIELPNRFVFGLDAQRQVELGVALYERLFGQPPRGMWPAEGAVSQQIISMVSDRGIQWMATDEGVLAKSIGLDGFTRDSRDVVQEADALYRPYDVQGRRGGPVAVVFRDVVISDKVGFTYSGMDGEAAAQDFIDRIHAIRAQIAASGAPGPHLVSVILDGENAWEHYANDGKAFLHGLYRRLSEDPMIRTVTPGEYLAMAPERPKIDELWAGSWISHDFATWIGEKEENDAWNLLLETREFVQKYETGARTPPSADALARALELMYIAEGSDWFWWYGADQNSGNDESFDQQFRDTLKKIYETLEEEPPLLLDVPIIPLNAATAERGSSGLIAPEIDGIIGVEEWADAGFYAAEGGVMQAGETLLTGLGFGFDSQNLYLSAVTADGALDTGRRQLDFYLTVPGGGPTNSFTGDRWVGFSPNRWLSLRFTNGVWTDSAFFTAQGGEAWRQTPLTEEIPLLFARNGSQVELAIPLDLIGNADIGDRLSVRLFLNEVGSGRLVGLGQMPSAGPAVLAVPDLGNLTVILEVNDPANDDYGPGTYTYPKDGVFAGGSFDILKFVAGYDESTIIFKFDLRGPVENHWGSPNGMSGLTLDIYIDKDGDNQGGRALLPGRNLALADGFAWDLAIHAEGWTAAIYEPGEAIVRIAEASQFQIVTDPGQRKVTIRVPKSLIGDDAENWRFAAMVLGQEGFPSGGVLRVRDVIPTAEQWRFGGAPVGVTNHTRVIDLVWPAAGEQESFLGAFTPGTTPQTAQTGADYATIPMLPPSP